MGRIKKTQNLAPVNWEEAKKNNHMRKYLFLTWCLRVQLIDKERHLVDLLLETHSPGLMA